MRKAKLLPNVPIWRQHNMIDKRDWKEVGSQIIITLGGPSREDNECNSWDHNNTNNIIPNTIHTIVDRPSRKSRKNGEFGVWVEGVQDKVFVWFHEWHPYTPPCVMSRTRYVKESEPQMTRQNRPVKQAEKTVILQRTVHCAMRRTK